MKLVLSGASLLLIAALAGWRGFPIGWIALLTGASFLCVIGWYILVGRSSTPTARRPDIGYAHDDEQR
jgi:hypothetical protein